MTEKKKLSLGGTTLKKLIHKGIKSAIPSDITPMLATLVDKPFDEPGWLYEVKWDGFRAVSYLNNGEIEIRSRNNKSFNEKFYPIYNALGKWKINAVIDGEIIVVNENGVANFNALQTWRSEADGELVYYLFDLLWVEGYNVMQLTLSERKKILELIAVRIESIRISESFDTGATQFFEVARRMQLEGIIAKKAESIYAPGVRTKEWLKIKTEIEQEAIIAGYTRNENTSKKFSALLLGVYENDKLQFIGPVGTGFSQALQGEILKKLKPLETTVCPFEEVPDYNKPSRFRPHPPKAKVTWVRPKIVAEISYREKTPDGALRHPSFKGLRDDKIPDDVVIEKPRAVKSIFRNDDAPLNKRLFKAAGKMERRTLLNPKDETQVRIVSGNQLKFNNLSKIYFPKVKVTKRDVINYYYQVAPYILPYLKDRPQTLIRHPDGITGEGFYQKDVKGKAPAWIKTFPYYSETDEREKEFLVCTNEASLLYMASLGCLEMHPWSSRIHSPGYPDWCIIDLDPAKNTFDQVIKAAQVTKEVLDAVAVPSYPKTSGSTGLHIYIPLGAKYTYEESKEFGRALAKIIHARLPSFTSIERLTQNRKGKMYIDFLQNRPQATLAAPYSLRPKSEAPVSMPLRWDEVKKGLKINTYTIANAMKRLKAEGDIFQGVLGEGINMKQVYRKIESVFS